jgi:hypothetical protein
MGVFNLDQMGGYDNSFSERQLKGEVELEQPRGPRPVNANVVNAFVTTLIAFAATLLIGTAWYVKANGIHTYFP